jgi:hypothetical protein
MPSGNSLESRGFNKDAKQPMLILAYHCEASDFT